jgi:hypothetical protein
MGWWEVAGATAFYGGAVAIGDALGVLQLKRRSGEVSYVPNQEKEEKACAEVAITGSTGRRRRLAQIHRWQQRSATRKQTTDLGGVRRSRSKDLAWTSGHGEKNLRREASMASLCQCQDRGKGEEWRGGPTLVRSS